MAYVSPARAGADLDVRRGRRDPESYVAGSAPLNVNGSLVR